MNPLRFAVEPVNGLSRCGAQRRGSKLSPRRARVLRALLPVSLLALIVGGALVAPIVSDAARRGARVARSDGASEFRAAQERRRGAAGVKSGDGVSPLAFEQTTIVRGDAVAGNEQFVANLSPGDQVVIDNISGMVKFINFPTSSCGNLPDAVNADGLNRSIFDYQGNVICYNADRIDPQTLCRTLRTPDFT